MDDNWEYGSKYHFSESWFQVDSKGVFDTKNLFLYNSGRAALLKAIDYFQLKYPGSKIFLPSYYCNDVFEYIEHSKIKWFLYDDSPNQSESEFCKQIEKVATTEDLILLVDYFGNRDINKFINNSYKYIIDITHSNYKLEKISDSCNFAFASFRKEFPVADGGWLWVNECKDWKSFETVNSSLNNNNSKTFLTAQIMKSLYLSKKILAKRYLKLFKSSEEAFSELPVSSMSDLSVTLLEAFSYQGAMDCKKRNLNLFHALFDRYLSSFNVDLLSNSTSFCAILQFDSREVREVVRMELITVKIYPFILWPIAKKIYEKYPKSKKFSDSILCLNADFRYKESDIRRVINTLGKILDRIESNKGSRS